MSSNQHGLNVTRPISLLNRTIRFNYTDFFNSTTKAVINGATGKFPEALHHVTDALASVRLEQECGEIAWLLIQRSLLQAVHDLLKENEALIYRDADNPSVILSKRGLSPDDPDAITARLDLSLEQSEITIDESFFRNPRALPVLEHFKTPFRQWLELFGLNGAEADSIANRLPSYFVHALNEQWRARSEDYKCLKEAFDTPFTKAGAAEQAWQSYSALLQKQVDEPMFVEAFSLRQVYVPLRAYYHEKPSTDMETMSLAPVAEAMQGQGIVLDLEEELRAWLASDDPLDAVRVISGGPGSGKSSFTRMLAAKLAEQNTRRVFFIPLRLLELSDDLEEAVRRFIRYVDRDLANPLAPEENVAPSLIIFDGLDELAMQGKIAAELAQQFIRDVFRKTDQLNIRTRRLKVLISGRELAIQTNASDFKRPKQILHVLPYFVPVGIREASTDPQRLLGQDQRQPWWKNYGKVSGQGYAGLPEDLDRSELLEITSQPLLNYLVALSYTRGEINLATESNLNAIYRDLLKAVYERGWGKGHHPALHDVPEDKFVRWLEEIAVAAWHGDGQTTTVQEIKGHTASSGAASLLSLFEEGADKGITRLLMAFYFRRVGARESGEKTFEFTHKSFGEYLTAKRVVRLLHDLHEELERHRENVDKGWDEREALRRWIQLCGPAAFDRYLFNFIRNEVRLSGASNASRWQETLCRLIEFQLRNGMPMEMFALATFKEATRQARNAEEALMVVLHACALTSNNQSKINWSHRTSLFELLARLQGKYPYSNFIIQEHLGFLDLSSQFLAFVNRRLINLHRSTLFGVPAFEANFMRANFRGANLAQSDFDNSDLRFADFRGANLSGASFRNARLLGIVFDKETNFAGAHLQDALFDGDNREQIILSLTGTGTEDALTNENPEEISG